MSATELQFRTSTFGGFHKQDVLDYIEQANREQADKLETMKKELDEALRAKSELAGQKEEAERRASALESQVDRLTGEEAQARRDGEEVRAALALAQERLAALEHELSAAQEALEKARPAAEAYESLKERTAGIELEAHHRALGIQAHGEEQAQKTRAEVEQWLHKVQAGYDRMRTDMDATLSHAAGELERVCRALEGLSGEFARQDAALGDIIEDCRENFAPRAPEPLPLDGE